MAVTANRATPTAMFDANANREARWSRLQEGLNRLHTCIESIDSTQQAMAAQFTLASTSLDRMRRGQQDMTKQLKTINQAVARLISSPRLRAMDGLEVSIPTRSKGDLMLGTPTVPWNLRPQEENVMCAVAGGKPTNCSTVCLTQIREEVLVSGDSSYLLQRDLVVLDAPQMFVGMSQQVSADQTLDSLPCESDWSDGNGREDGEVVPWVKELPVAGAASKQAECEENSLVAMQVTRNVSTNVDCSSPYLEFGVIHADQLFKEMPLEATWDDEMQSDIRLHEGLLKQLAQGENYFVGVDRKLPDEPPECVLPEHVEFVDSVGAEWASFKAPTVTSEDEAELFDDRSLCDVIWDKEISEELFDEKSVPGVIWDEEMPSDYAEQEEFDGPGSVATILVLAEQQDCSGLKKACLHFLSSLSILGDVRATDGFEHLARSCPSTMKELIFNLPTRAPVNLGEASQVNMGRCGMFFPARLTIMGHVELLQINTDLTTRTEALEKKLKSDSYLRNGMGMLLFEKLAWKHGFSPGRYELQSTLDPSVRMQWDPGISTATAWGQAVFRGAGNVITWRWAKRSPITRAVQPKTKDNSSYRRTSKQRWKTSKK